jgi:abhydrolase domain-containing protein 6
VGEYIRANKHYVQVWNLVNLYDDVLVHAPFARKPTLVVWGNRDRVFPVSGASELQGRIAQSEVHVLPNGGHLLHREKIYRGDL